MKLLDGHMQMAGEERRLKLLGQNQSPDAGFGMLGLGSWETWASASG